jgi:L,D-peptidoglycan transpeptidase YkuD (ErfK/YbiS/YcfS/YnhG family)
MDINVLSDGTIRFDGKVFRAALGRGGVSTDKKEGDGATPAGSFPLREVLYRADRIQAPRTLLPTSVITEVDGWCDDVADPERYNTRILLPYEGSHERLFRDDHVYDLIVPIGYNDDPARPGKGSAIFIHIARDGYPPTAGCVALAESDLRELLARVTPDTRIVIHAA